MRRTSAKNKQNEKRNENLKFLFEVINPAEKNHSSFINWLLAHFENFLTDLKSSS